MAKINRKDESHYIKPWVISYLQLLYRGNPCWSIFILPFQHEYKHFSYTVDIDAPETSCFGNIRYYILWWPTLWHHLRNKQEADMMILPRLPVRACSYVLASWERWTCLKDSTDDDSTSFPIFKHIQTVVSGSYIDDCLNISDMLIIRLLIWLLEILAGYWGRVSADWGSWYKCPRARAWGSIRLLRH